MPGDGAEPDTVEKPQRTGWRDFWIDLGWLAALMVWATAWCVTASPHIGPTYDEPLYLDAGLKGWRKDWSDLMQKHGVMPLPPAVSSYPLHRLEEREGKLDRPVEHLHTARQMTLGWLLLLYFSAMRLGRAAAGPWAGRIAAGLLAADPNLLAHGTLATTDIAITATLMLFAYVVYAGRSGGWWWRIVLPGICYGIAVLTKLSALLYGGLILVVLEVGYRFSSGALARPEDATLGRWARVACGVTLRSVIAVAAVILIGIGIAIERCGTSEPGSYPLRDVVHMVPEDHPARADYERYAEEYDQVPYAVVAFAFQWGHNLDGRATYLNGVHYEEGVWFYFPLLMLMKSPLPVLVLAVLALLRPRAAFNAITITALVLLAVTMWKARIQIGLRLAFPVMALCYVGVAIAIIRGFRCRGVYAGVCAVLVTAGVSIWVWPHGLSYLNQLYGGPDAAPTRVTDSNHDWGQGIPELMEWHRANGESPITLWYFGSDPAAWQPPFTIIAAERWKITTAEQFRGMVGQHVLAVSDSTMTIAPDATPAKAVAVEYLRSITPIARTRTFTIYDFRTPPQSSDNP